MLNNIGNAENQALLAITEAGPLDVSKKMLAYLANVLDSHQLGLQSEIESHRLSEPEFNYLLSWSEEFIDLLICTRRSASLEGVLLGSVVLSKIYLQQSHRDEEIRDWYAMRSGELYEVVSRPSHKVRNLLDRIREASKLHKP